MSRLWKVLVLIAFAIIAIFFVRVILNQDDSPSTTTNDFRVAETEWNALDPIAQDVICDLWSDHKKTGDDDLSILETMGFDSESLDPGLAEAKIVLMERECDELL